MCSNDLAKQQKYIDNILNLLDHNHWVNINQTWHKLFMGEQDFYVITSSQKRDTNNALTNVII